MTSEPGKTTGDRQCTASETSGPLKGFGSAMRPFRGWILYDGVCRSCTAFARHLERMFRLRGFRFLPLQTGWVMKRLGLGSNAPPGEMHVLTADDQDLTGSAAVIFLAQQLWWTYPLALLARLPGAHKLLAGAYRWIAAHRGYAGLVSRSLP